MTPRPTGPGDSPGFLLWRTTLRWQRAITTALRPLGLTHVQFVLLASAWWLSDQAATGIGAEAPGAMPSQRQLAAQAGVDVMMTSQVIRALTARHLLVGVEDPADARVRRVTVTADGRRLALRAIDVVETADAAFFGGVRDRAQVLDVLLQLSGDTDDPC